MGKVSAMPPGKGEADYSWLLNNWELVCVGLGKVAQLCIYQEGMTKRW